MRYSGDEPLKVIIFDWDDTICPSSFYDRQQMEHMDELPESVSHRSIIQRCIVEVDALSRSRKNNVLLISTMNCISRSFLYYTSKLLSSIVVYRITRFLLK
jgi:hypothetical protein